MKDDSRMNQLLEALKMSQQDLATATGIKRANINHFATGRRPISKEAAQRIQAVFPTVNLNWLLGGQGEMFVSTPTLPEQDQPKKKGRSAGDRAFDAIENNPDLEKILEAMERENERLKGENERQKGIIEYLEKKLEDRGGAPWQDPKGPISAGMDH
jgi:transcriptional regulator with XRE-family HTH domain